MLSINPRRSVVTLAVMAGLLAVAGPASAQGGGADFTRLVDRVAVVTMLDYEGAALLDNHAGDLNIAADGRGVDPVAADAVSGDDRLRALVPLDVYALIGLLPTAATAGPASAITYNGHAGLGSSARLLEDLAQEVGDDPGGHARRSPGRVAHGIQLHDVEPDHATPSGHLGQDRTQLAVAEPARLR
jgi:hypothetical protein